jgi:competence protein ComEA
MSDPPIRPPTRRQALIARGEQLVLVILAVALVAGVAWRAMSYYRIGAEPMEVIPAASPICRIDVNTADWVTLTAVPGLGESLSRRIVAERDRRPGRRFGSLDDLRCVHGIGDRTLARLRPYLFTGDGSRGEAEAVQMLDRPPGDAAPGRETKENAGHARNDSAGR